MNLKNEGLLCTCRLRLLFSLLSPGNHFFSLSKNIGESEYSRVCGESQVSLSREMTLSPIPHYQRYLYVLSHALVPFLFFFDNAFLQTSRLKVFSFPCTGMWLPRIPSCIEAFYLAQLSGSSSLCNAFPCSIKRLLLENPLPHISHK